MLVVISEICTEVVCIPLFNLNINISKMLLVPYPVVSILCSRHFIHAVVKWYLVVYDSNQCFLLHFAFCFSLEYIFFYNL